MRVLSQAVHDPVQSFGLNAGMAEIQACSGHSKGGDIGVRKAVAFIIDIRTGGSVYLIYWKSRNGAQSVMKYRITPKSSGLDIEVTDIADEKEKLFKAFQECQENRCSCPTDEYEKLKSLEIEQSEDEIQLHLEAKADSVLDKSEIEKCMEYTRHKVAQTRGT